MTRQTRWIIATALPAAVALAGFGCGGQGNIGVGGGTISFTIAGKTFTFRFGFDPIEVTANQSTGRIGFGFNNALGGVPETTPATGTMSLPSSSVTTGRRLTAKGTPRAQELPLNGTATIRFFVASGVSAAACESAVLLAEFRLAVSTGMVTILDEEFDLSSEAIAVLLTNDVTICIEITADYDGVISIGDADVSFGGDSPDSAAFTLHNADTLENIHILLPDEDFDPASNRLTPGASRSVTLSDVTEGTVVSLRAGRNGVVLDTADCPAIVGNNYQATGEWDGLNLTCTATQDESGGGGDSDGGTDEGPSPGTIIQVPVYNDAGASDPAPVTSTVNGVDYGVVGVLYDQTPETGYSTSVPNSMSVDLAELGLASVQTIYLAIHSSFVADLPDGVDMGTLSVNYAEGGSPTTLDFVLGSNTAEWSYDRPENAPVAHSLAETLFTFPTTIDSASEYDGREYAVRLSVDSSRTISCITLTIAPGSTYAAFREPGSPTATWASQYVAAMTFEGPAGTPTVIGDCSGVVIPPGGEGEGEGEGQPCDSQLDCPAGQVCSSESLTCVPDEPDTPEDDPEDPVTSNGDFDEDEVVILNTPEAAVMCRVGDIDNLNFGFPAGFDPFSGNTTPAHAYPWAIDPTDPDGTDRIMVISSYAGTPPAGLDGYTTTTTRPDNAVQPINLNCDPGDISVTSAILQIFVDDFQAPVWQANYQVTLDGQRAPFLEEIINALAQTGPVGQLITVNVPDDFLGLLEDGSLTIVFDDNTTGAGDGYAIDFVKLLINPGSVVNTGTITGTVVDDATDLPIAGATVSAGGVVDTATDADGQYTLTDVPAGLAVVLVSADGYASQIASQDLIAGETLEIDFRLTASSGEGGPCSADGVCDEECPVDTPDPDCAEVCAADGFCNENCSDLDPDPDCDLTPSGEPQCTATSTFETGDEGWTLTGDAEGGRLDPDYNFTGGNPGAFISADDDVTGGTWYFQAPAKFHGDFSAAYGRTLTFDLMQSTLASQFDGRDVIVTGNGMLIWFNTAQNPGTDWTPYSITLDAAAGWLGNNDSPASEDLIRDVLSNIDDLQIRGEYVSGADTGGLDNVVLSSDCP